MRSIRGVVVVVAALAAAGARPSPAASQEPSGLAFVGGIGYRSGGPGQALIEGMREAGLDGTRFQRCIGCQSEIIQYPLNVNEGINLSGFLGARYKFPFPITAEVLLSNGPRGHAEGYGTDNLNHLIVRYASFLMTGSLSAFLGPIGVEGGPALVFTSWETSVNSHDAESGSTIAVGTHAALLSRVRVGDTLVTLRTGRRWIPSADVRTHLAVPSDTDYRAYYVSLTVSPLISF